MLLLYTVFNGEKNYTLHNKLNISLNSAKTGTGRIRILGQVCCSKKYAEGIEEVATFAPSGSSYRMGAGM